MNNRELKKKAAAARRQRKVERQLIAIAAGAGYFWMAEGYFEAQDDVEKCLGKYLGGILRYFGLPDDSVLTRTWNLQYFSTPKKGAKKVIGELDRLKEVAKCKAAADETREAS